MGRMRHGCGRSSRLPMAIAAAAVAISASAPERAAAAFAPLAAPGPRLSVAPSLLAAAMQCSAGVEHARRAPVLLLAGTGANAKDNWSWTYEPAFDKLGIPWCTADLPQHGTADIQVAAQYVVYAMRTMHARAGRRIAVIGHSQGGMIPRWALRFWPDTRALVDDVIGFAPSNHGTTTAAGACKSGCSAADWQQSNTSDFTRALNSGAETFPGISYTDVYTHTDEVVQPNSNDHGSSSLHGGGGLITNVATQEICPADTNEHLAIGTVDPVAYALAIDALGHPGPADPARISRSVCLQTLQPGVNPVTFPQNASSAAADFAAYQSVSVPAEPRAACYVTAACPPSIRLLLATSPVRATAGRRARIHVIVTAGSSPLAPGTPVAGARVSVGGDAARTDRSGRATLTVSPARAGRLAVHATQRGYLMGTSVLHVSRR